MPRTVFDKATDAFFSFKTLRKAYWKFWYPLLTRRLGKDPLFFLNYAFVDSPLAQFSLQRSEEHTSELQSL